MVLQKLFKKVNISCKLDYYLDYLNKSKELLIILRQIVVLRNKTGDEELLKDYTIYIHDICRFLRRLPSKTIDEIQVYIDDYQTIGQYAKVMNSVSIDN